MNISRPFIRRPIATGLMAFALLVVGLMAYRLMSVSALPEVDYPTIQVYTQYPGAAPDVMSSSVTAPLEKQFGQMAGLKRMNSTSALGVSLITLQFQTTTSLDEAEQEVQAAINSADSTLPSNLPYPPVYNKVNPADTAILTLAVTSDTLPLTRVEDLADTRIAQKLSQVGGVGLVTLSGGARPAVRVQTNTRALNAMGLSLEDVRTAIGDANVNTAKGSIDGPLQAFTIDANDQLGSADEYAKLVLAYKNGAPVRLADVASITEAAENPRQAAWSGTAPAIVINVQRQPGANVIEVVDRIEALLPQLRATMPSTVKIGVLSDRTRTIRASVREVKFELAAAVALVVMVIFVFLRRAALTLIPAVTVPFALVGTLAVIYVLGFSVNNLTLMALTVATGFVVDDAIVMLENVMRHIEAGETPLDAALKGAREIGFTILSISVALVAVLIPLFFMPDVIGRLFREFAVTLAVAIVVSAWVSLTLTPMMASRMLRAQVPAQVSSDPGPSADFMDRLGARYMRALDWALSHQAAVTAGVALTAASTIALFVFMQKGFFPEQDTGLIEGIAQASPKVSFERMASLQQVLAQQLSRDPAVQSVSSLVGIDRNNATLNTARMLITLKDGGDTSRDVIARLAKATDGRAGMKLYLHPVQDLTLDDQINANSYRIGVQATDDAELAQWTSKLLAALRADPLFTDVQSQARQQGNVLRIDFDRATASRLGISAADVDNLLYDAFGDRQVSTIYTHVNQYHVTLGADAALLGTNPLAVFDGLYVGASSSSSSTSSTSSISSTSSSSSGSSGSTSSTTSTASSSSGSGGTAMAPLSGIASASLGSSALTVQRQGQFPYADVSFNVAAGVTLGTAVERVERIEAALRAPASVQISLEGAAELYRSSMANEALLLAGALIAVYILLGMLYESLVHPLTILSTLPSAAFGALGGLLLVGDELDIIGLIGIVLLVGIVMKNAIMMVDFALAAERESGLSARDAIRRACELRLRPILMTTCASLVGALPLAFGTGMGHELRQPLGVAIIGGLAVSQLLTLFSTPVIYLGLHRLAARLAGRRRRGEGAERAAGE
ncbi:efflux RND transporter permease subunit [Trinickia caryophylli]|uniref:Multidrug efflux pump n=1 Tax=Trinickia caryophylli TaxID=28094 RepID=A0A1X7FVY0_TRICW|nr:efflux RND transporter permease subunit [Trinickia caryophylli]PMS11812.1 multidrug transporter subunit MdtC [Trinickia caryophylli]TRX17495.1 multidrug transporter subunit MdtC [Trinickia caryophylli]WQE11759.1 efflux RND transporter permease subunit [Trinickia caryophylli]SMF59656.1 multidrug efflux pump [Trinickia caryophylli]GLU34743.1 multidrug resistance protein MdtB [Trinickia caryophylli]